LGKTFRQKVAKMLAILTQNKQFMQKGGSAVRRKQDTSWYLGANVRILGKIGRQNNCQLVGDFDSELLQLMPKIRIRKEANGSSNFFKKDFQFFGRRFSSLAL
jgi:hypothetical protein